MTKPKNAERGEEYWKGRSTSWGSIIGDEGVLIRPNYPDIFALSDKLTALGIKNEVRPFDVYQGPYIEFAALSSFHHPLQIWYSEDYPLTKWSIVSELKPVYARDDEETLEVISSILPLLCIRQS